jgi:hypothetical protein
VGSRAVGAYDWSKVDWITVRRERSERHAFRGVCRSPREGHGGYRINCNVNMHARYPMTQFLCVSPLYRNPAGTWPKLPEGLTVGGLYATSRNGKSVQWKRLYRLLGHSSEDEVSVLLVAHEAFHYLRRTRQVDGRHGEIKADAFALRILEQYRDEPT